MKITICWLWLSGCAVPYQRPLQLIEWHLHSSVSNEFSLSWNSFAEKTFSWNNLGKRGKTFPSQQDLFFPRNQWKTILIFGIFEKHLFGQLLEKFGQLFFIWTSGHIGREPWSSDYGWRLMFERLRVGFESRRTIINGHLEKFSH